MSFFIRCVSPSYLRGALYALKDGMPHRLADPRSLDRDWFRTSREAAAAKVKAEKKFPKLVAPALKFRVERNT